MFLSFLIGSCKRFTMGTKLFFRCTRENVTQAMTCSVNIRPIQSCYVNDCECGSNATDLFYVDVGATTISYRDCLNWMYLLNFDSFAIPNFILTCFT